jgi:DNA-directed RNA polymerase specialized sigma24 family protein
MTQQQRQAIEQMMTGLSAEEKREVAERILQSLRIADAAAVRSVQQREALNRLCQTVEAIPTAEHVDGLTNHDHDRLIYTR